MSDPVVAGRKPLLVRFERTGDARFWCACGRSARQPLCDGSHKGTAFAPVRVVARHDREEALLCCCKRTKTPPYCDGSHNALGAYDDGGSDDAIDWAAAAAAPRGRGAGRRADLDGGCYVLTPDWNEAFDLGGCGVLPTITRQDGADRLSQFLLRPNRQQTEPLSFGGAEVVLFLARGAARVLIGAAAFDAPTHSAITVRPGEAFAIDAIGASVEIAATVCPPEPPRPSAGAVAFDAQYKERVTPRGDAGREAMGARFYQVLTAAEKGAVEATGFIGAVPCSRAAAHRHLYEETLLILSGEGVMWTPTRKATVGPGDVVYLPRKQLHSLECVSPEGMTLAGSFFPAGSPAINY